MSELDRDVHLRDTSTTDLVKELFIHGRHLVEVEAQRLRHELSQEIGDVRGDGHVALEEARGRIASGVAAIKADLREQKTRAVAAAKPMTIGGVLLHAGVLVLLAALTMGLATFMERWLAALIVGAVTAGIGGLLLGAGAKAFKQVGQRTFVRTNQQMVEDRKWMSETTASLKGRLKHVTQAFKNGVELPRLRPSSSVERAPTT